MAAPTKTSKDAGPNVLDRMVAWVSPSRGLRRMAARSAMTRASAFEGASKGRRTKNWNPGNEHINAMTQGTLPILRARSRDLVRNNAWAAGAVEAIVSETIGAGILPQAKDQDAAYAAKVDDLWIKWGDTTLCDAEGMSDFYGLQALVMKTVAEAGSCLIRRRYRRASDGLPVPIQLQVLEPEYLDVTKDTYFTESGGNLTISGIEFDKMGRRRGYWLFQEHPATRSFQTNLKSTFVAAEDVIHVFRVDRAGQVDGVPWGAPILLRLRDLDEYEDAELVKQKIAACFAGFVHDTEALEDQTALTQAQKDELGRMEPGMIEVLPPGKEITFGSPPAATGYGEHVPWQLRAVARAFGVTYEACTGDYSRVNFSSGRMGRLAMNRNIARWQQHLIIPRLCQGVWSWFCDAATYSGALPRPAGVRWTTPRIEMIDPTSETAAVRDQVRSGFTTLSEAIRQSGRDPAEVLAERKKDDQELDRLGIVVDTDPRQRTSQGNPAITPTASASKGKTET